MGTSFESHGGPLQGDLADLSPHARPRPYPAVIDDASWDAAAFVERVHALLVRIRHTKRARRGPFLRAALSITDPARCAATAGRALRRYGAATAKDAGISTLRQFVWTWRLNRRWEIDPGTIYRHRLFSSDVASPVPAYLAGPYLMVLYRLTALIGDRTAAETLADKRRFAEWCRAREIPTVPVLMEFANGEVARSHLADGTLPPVDLFAKWGTSLGGAQTVAWTHHDGRWSDGSGRVLSADEIVRHLAERSRHNVVILQPRMRSHPTLARISPNALSTVRVMTTRRPGEQPRFLAGVLRMGVGDSTADNFAQGGIASAIDAESGVIGEARKLDELLRTRVYEHHPDTGAPIAGACIPRWPEVVGLALDAHARLGSLAVVGWDVAVLDDESVVLLEGNWNPCLKLLQIATQTPALRTELGPCMEAWLDGPARDLDDDWLADHSGWFPNTGHANGDRSVGTGSE